MPDREPLIVDVQGIGPVEFPAGTSGAQIEAWVIQQLRQQQVPSQSWGQWLGNQAARVGGGIVGGAVGSLAGPVGTFAGTATGAAMGDEWAQSREVAQGVREAVNPLEMLAAGATAPIPGATLKRGAPLLRQAPRAFAAAVPGAAASSAGLQLAETGTVDPWRTAMDTGRGSVLGGIVGLGVPAAVRGAQSQAAQKLIRDETGAIRAYHGSPHDFDQFSTTKIGTGEGAQMAGHGLYFGDQPDTGRNYRDMVPVDGRAKGEPLDTNMRVGRELVTDLYRRLDLQAARLSPKVAEPIYDRMSALESLMHKGDMLGVEEAAQAGQISPEALAWMRKEVAPKFKRTGKLYEVNIDADPDDMLDLDAPLSEAHAKKLQALLPSGTAIPPEGLDMSGGGRILPNHERQVADKPYPYILKSGDATFGLSEQDVARLVGGGDRPTGTQAYSRLSMALGGNPQASEVLRAAGIPGLKYLDQGSRDAGEGSSNYVVFDDKLISILRKYGLLPFASLGNVGNPQRDERKKP